MKAQLINDTWWKFFARFLIGCLVASPWLVITKIIGITNLENSYLLMVLKYFFPHLLMGYSLFFVADLINKRLGLLQVADGHTVMLSKDDEQAGVAEIDLDLEDSRMLNRSQTKKNE